MEEEHLKRRIHSCVREEECANEYIKNRTSGRHALECEAHHGLYDRCKYRKCGIFWKRRCRRMGERLASEEKNLKHFLIA